MRTATLAISFLILCIAAVNADVVALKDGNVIECKVIENTIRNGKKVMIVELEDGSKKTIPLANVGWVSPGKPSWILREEAKKWYDKEVARKSEKLETRWKDNEAIGKQLRRKKLDDLADKHFTTAYELRIKEAKDTIKEHEKIARWLERTCNLFPLAAKEWEWVYQGKLKVMEAKGKTKDKDYEKIGVWAEKVSLYDQAKSAYEKALALNPKNKKAKKGIERIEQLKTVLINPKFFRTVKGQMAAAVKYFRGKQNGSGSYGGDINDSGLGIQGERGITALCVLAMIAQWEFESIEKPAVLQKAPRDMIKAIEYLCSARVDTKKLRGPDTWGNMWTPFALMKVLRHKHLEKYHARAKTKIKECFQGLASIQGPDGGFMYYHFAKKTSVSFVGGPAIMAMVEAKKEGIAINEQSYSQCLGHLKKMKQQDGVWMYRTTVKQKVEGCQGRASACELGLLAAGEGSMQALQLGVENFFKYRNILEAVYRKRGTHIGTGQTAPYYYAYGHYWVGKAIQRLDSAAQDKFMAKLRDLHLKDQDPDGSFWDWPMGRPHHQVYGSALGALTLYNIATIYKDTSATVKKRR